MGRLPNEVVHGLLLSQPADGRQHAERVAAQHDDVARVAAHAGDLGVGDVLDGVAGASVLSDGAARREGAQGKAVNVSSTAVCVMRRAQEGVGACGGGGWLSGELKPGQKHSL